MHLWCHRRVSGVIGKASVASVQTPTVIQWRQSRHWQASVSSIGAPTVNRCCQLRARQWLGVVSGKTDSTSVLSATTLTVYRWCQRRHRWWLSDVSWETDRLRCHRLKPWQWIGVTSWETDSGSVTSVGKPTAHQCYRQQHWQCIGDASGETDSVFGVRLINSEHP
jgi:hypothetical protein